MTDTVPGRHRADGPTRCADCQNRGADPCTCPELVTVRVTDFRAVLRAVDYVRNRELLAPVDRLGDAVALATMRAELAAETGDGEIVQGSWDPRVPNSAPLHGFNPVDVRPSGMIALVDIKAGQGVAIDPGTGHVTARAESLCPHDGRSACWECLPKDPPGPDSSFVFYPADGKRI